MATLPLSGSNIKFLTGVPFSNDYKNTRWFSNTDEQYSYFINQKIVHTMTSATFVRDEGKGYISVNAPIDLLLETNYLMFQNTHYNSKWFYAFVTKLERKNQNVTFVYFELDVLQTWLKNYTFKPSFVVREHTPLWNADGSPVINTVDEGLNYGLEYDDVYVNHYVPNNGVKFIVIVAKQQIHGSSKDKHIASYNGIAQPLSYYVLPIFLDGEGLIWLKDDGDEIAMSEPEKLFSKIYEDDKATGNISAIYLTNSIGCPFTISGGGESFTRIKFTEKDQKFEGAEIGTDVSCLYVKDLKRYMTETFDLGNKYANLPSYKESKLYMYPYTVLTLDDFKGNRTDYKLENIQDSNLLLNMKGSIGLSNKVSYGLQKYNDKATMTNHQDNQYAIIDSNPQDIPVITDLLAAYLQGNKNSIENQKNSIMFNGGMGMVQSAVGAAGGIASSKNPISMGVNAVSGVADVVKGAGNTVLQLQSLEAKQQDIRNMPNQITKQGSNTAYDYGHRYDGVTFIKKTLKPEYRRKLEHFFNMFGYKVNEVKIPNFHTRQNWNYVQTTSCNIVGDFNNEDLNELKAVFDNGITLWHTDDVGNYSLSNEVI